MRVRVNGVEAVLAPGMKVRHALLQTGLLSEIAAGKKVYDARGNEVGLDGALHEGAELYVR